MFARPIYKTKLLIQYRRFDKRTSDLTAGRRYLCEKRVKSTLKNEEKNE